MVMAAAPKFMTRKAMIDDSSAFERGDARNSNSKFIEKHSSILNK